jgi:glutathione S-transferase
MLKAIRATTLLLVALLTSATVHAADAAANAKMPALTIYHIEGTRAERLVWLCEELGLPYQLEFKAGDPAASMRQIREINPLMPVSPTVRYGDQVLVESGAIIQLILARHAGGRLQPDVSSTDFPYHLQWMHFAEGSLAARVVADSRVARLKGAREQEQEQQRQSGFRPMDANGVVRFADDFLQRHPYFGGQDFSAADIMMLFPIAYADMLKVIELEQFPNVVAWRKRVEARPAYQRMVEKARARNVSR